MPLRPILSMTNSPQHKLARWLVEVLKPLAKKLDLYSVADSFELVEKLKDMNIGDEHMCSIDVQSLSTNVPLTETVDFICEQIEEENLWVPVPTDYLRTLILLCTKDVNFNFLNEPYCQIDGVAMGSPLGPMLANFFMIMIEKRLTDVISRLTLYIRYVDDTLLIYKDPSLIKTFIDRLNTAHPNLAVTEEAESNNCLPFWTF